MGLILLGSVGAASDATMATVTAQTSSLFRAALTPLIAAVLANNPTVAAAAASAASSAVATEISTGDVVAAISEVAVTRSTRSVVPLAFRDKTRQTLYPSVYPSVYPGVTWTSGARRYADVPVLTPAGTLPPEVIPAKPLGVLPSLAVQPEGLPVAFEVTPDGTTVIRKAVFLNADDGVKRVAAIGCMGQSNEMAYAFPIVPFLDHTSGRIWQLTPELESLTPASVPLAYVGTQPGLSPSHILAREIVAADPECAVVLVPVGVNGSSLVAENTQGNWSVDYAGPNPALYARAVAAMDRAVAQAIARWGIEPTVMANWVQGESETGTTRSQYETKLDALISDWTSRYGGMFLIGGINPQTATSGSRPDIVRALQDTPRRKERTAYVPGVDNGGGSRGPSDEIHYGREAVEIIGRGWFKAIPRASNNVAGSFTTPPLVVKATRWGNEVTVEWSHPYCRVTAFEVQSSTDGTTWTPVTVTEPVATRAVFTSAAPVQVRVRAIGTETSNWTAPVVAIGG